MANNTLTNVNKWGGVHSLPPAHRMLLLLQTQLVHAFCSTGLLTHVDVDLSRSLFMARCDCTVCHDLQDFFLDIHCCMPKGGYSVGSGVVTLHTPVCTQHTEISMHAHTDIHCKSTEQPQLNLWQVLRWNSPPGQINAGQPDMKHLKGQKTSLRNSMP